MTRPAAGTKLPVPVTDAHLDRAKPEDACENVIALAVTDAALTAGLVPAVDSVSAIYADHDQAVNARIWIEPGNWLRLTFGADGWELLSAADAGQLTGPCTLLAEVA